MSGDELEEKLILFRNEALKTKNNATPLWNELRPFLSKKERTDIFQDLVEFKLGNRNIIDFKKLIDDIIYERNKI